jgi:hypothetical protein
MAKYSFGTRYHVCENCGRTDDPFAVINQPEKLITFPDHSFNKEFPLCSKCHIDWFYLVDADVVDEEHFRNCEEPPENKPEPDWALVRWEDHGDGAGQQIFLKWIWRKGEMMPDSLPLD